LAVVVIVLIALYVSSDHSSLQRLRSARIPENGLSYIEQVPGYRLDTTRPFSVYELSEAL